MTIKMEITINGRTYGVRTARDTDTGAPWAECDGHGIVSEWTRRDKRAGELLLASERGSHRFYDYAATVKRALAEGWDSAPYSTGTARQRAARAAMQDYEYLRAWCADEWWYIGLIVTGPDGEFESLWGIESHDEDLDELAQSLAESLESSYQDSCTDESTV